jgi:hypothetical protein
MTIWNDTILDSMVTELLKLLKRTRKDGPDKFNLAVRLSVKSVAPLPGSQTTKVSAMDSPLVTVTGSMARST